jgi:hypothetical protein
LLRGLPAAGGGGQWRQREFVSGEEGRFCNHRGADWRDIRDRLQDVDDIGAARGVSTIPRQVAKKLFLWQGRSYRTGHGLHHAELSRFSVAWASGQ